MRPLPLLVALPVVLACKTPPPAEPPPPATTAGASSHRAAPPRTEGDLSWPTPTECAAPTGEIDSTIAQDVRTIVGGNFSVDHIGPEAFAAIEARVKASPDAYLDAWAQQAFGATAQADAYWANLLGRTAELRPARTRSLAGCLSSRLDQALAAPPEDRDPDWELRVGDGQRALYLLWRGLTPDDTWRLAQPTRACLDGTTLTVEADCTCGEPVVCEVTAGPGQPDALVTLDLTRGGMCRDCYPGTGTCTMPAIADARAITPTLNGRTLPVTPCPLP